MRMFKAGNRGRKGFTLLELLMVMAIISILSFSVVYTLGDRDGGVKASQKVIEKLLKVARTTAILRNKECRFLVLKNIEDNGRLLGVLMKDKETWKAVCDFIELREGMQVEFENDNEMCWGDGCWRFASFSSKGWCRDKVYLKSSDEDMGKKLVVAIGAGGRIEVEK